MDAKLFVELSVQYASIAFALSCLLSRMTPETRSAVGEIWLIAIKFMKTTK